MPACGEALWIDGDPWAVRTLRTGASRPAPAAQPNPSAGYMKPYKSASVGSSSGSSGISSGKAGLKKPIPKPAPKPDIWSDDETDTMIFSEN